MGKSVWQMTIIDKMGNVVPNASIEIRNENNNALVSIWLDRDGEIPGGNPLYADGDGYVFACLDPGCYRITASYDFGKTVWRDVFIIGDAGIEA